MAKRQRSEAQKAARRADYSAMTSEERVIARLEAFIKSRDE